MKLTIDEIVKKYNLQPHPEGGYYAETWRSEKQFSIQNEMTRSHATSIIFLLPGNTFSAFHRIVSDELWNYHAGASIFIYEIIEDEWQETILGTGINEKLQHLVKGGTWFASRCSDEESYSLCGCTVVPGFDFADFEMADRTALTSVYPELAEGIKELTR